MVVNIILLALWLNEILFTQKTEGRRVVTWCVTAYRTRARSNCVLHPGDRLCASGLWLPLRSTTFTSTVIPIRSQIHQQTHTDLAGISARRIFMTSLVPPHRRWTRVSKEEVYLSKRLATERKHKHSTRVAPQKVLQIKANIKQPLL